MSTNKKRRPLQFGLRGLLVLLAIACGCLVWKTNQVRNQRKLLELVDKRNGTVFYDYQMFGDSIDTDASPPGPAFLRRVLGDDYFQKVASVSLSECTDENATLIGRVPSIELLSLDNTDISDAALKSIGRLPKLRHLQLMGTQIGDQGLAHLQNPQLKKLHLNNTLVTDKGLKHLSRLTSLETLSLSNNNVRPSPVTDEGFQHLGKLTNLKVLKADGTGITNEGLRHLSELSKLEHLLVFGNTTGDGLQHLSGLKNLEILELSGRGMFDGLQHLLPLGKLTRLDFRTADDLDASKLKTLQPLPRLTTIWWYIPGDFPDLSSLEQTLTNVDIIVTNRKREQRSFDKGR